MVEAHTLDAWTRMADRASAAYRWAIVVGGFGAPAFLFLAGVSLALAAGARVRKGSSDKEAAAKALRRGWQIFALAFLFRFQSWAISGGAVTARMKVDILNVMGVSMLAAAVLWGLGRANATRALLLGCAAVAVAMLSPIVRATPLLTPLPDPIEWYLRPYPGRTTFTLFPWGGFLLAGAAMGLWVNATRTEREERRLMLACAIAGPAMASAGYAASFLPPLYAETNFWTSSPTFFFLRLGILITALPLAYLLVKAPRQLPIRELGIASLFVYWIHVEMVYGVVSTPIHRQLTFAQALVAFTAFSVFLFWLVKLKERATREGWIRTPSYTSSWRLRRG
jgi:uncharacterized membrane protein